MLYSISEKHKAIPRIVKAYTWEGYTLDMVYVTLPDCLKKLMVSWLQMSLQQNSQTLPPVEVVSWFLLLQKEVPNMQNLTAVVNWCELHNKWVWCRIE